MHALSPILPSSERPTLEREVDSPGDRYRQSTAQGGEQAELMCATGVGMERCWFDLTDDAPQCPDRADATITGDGKDGYSGLGQTFRQRRAGYTRHGTGTLLLHAGREQKHLIFTTSPGGLGIDVEDHPFA